MGMTGSGKSSLVALCTDEQVGIGHDLHACTQDVRTYSFRHPKLRSGRIHLVDTPGFDDTNRSDTEILRILAAWLTRTYSNGVQLSGILYLHRINQPRMQGSALKNISLFRSLCGNDALKKVVLVTTMWDITEKDIAESREKQLKDTTKYWGGMVAKGSQVIRHDNTQNSALALFNAFMKEDEKITLQIQSEMVDGHQPLQGTDAGNDIKEMLAEQHEKFKRERQDLEIEFREALRKKDEELADALEELKCENQKALQQVLDSQQRLQVTVQQLQESEASKLKGRSKNTQHPYFPDDRLLSSISSAAAPSPTQPLKAWVKILYSKDIQTQSDDSLHLYYFDISPDETCMGIMCTDDDISMKFGALISIATGIEILRYSFKGGHRGLRPLYSLEGGHRSLGPITFSSDGQTMAMRTNRGFHKWHRLSSYLEEWREATEFLGYNEEARVSFSTNLELIAQQRRDSIRLVLGSSMSVLMERVVHFDFETHHGPIFGKKDETLISWSHERLLFWDIQRSGQSWKVVDYPDHYLPGLWCCTASGNSLWLAATNIPEEGKVETSIFRLSGQCPEFVTKIDTSLRGGSANNLSMSFDGAYILFTNSREATIFNVMTGKPVWSVEIGQDTEMKFFPSSNRLLSYSAEGESYSVSELVFE
ncbi:hypothetical protein F5B22DRAFT_201784 [Xylaria bambusicola]|uniref:uncharacterized protein n=1 Tax=Xylaria bambusicola TaxID=326684 RepID=UPI0020083DE5|nr:uncharacterized protein F5B22DRAFT_201784 [Xylaria bambusicola]KAI0515096.1 hypothetical protein F5B22DRAFT_201784 [Xylaria bambusicola]